MSKAKKGAEKVLVLMSGGVDSALAAALLQQQGCHVEGLYLRLLMEGKEDELSPAMRDAGRVADHLGIRLHVLDLRKHFWRSVVEPFVEAYSWGRTPNPCVPCNPQVKFGPALEEADRRSIGYLASGHYARIERDEEGRPRLRRAADASRDQSYFLHRLPGEILPRIIFPLGEMSKTAVRVLARELRLPVADREDSQEICFIPKGGLQAFLRNRIPLCSHRPGLVRHVDGRELGRHDGIHRFTVGQRRGLKVATGRPVYVTAIDAASGTVTVGDDTDLLGTSMTLTDVTWAVPPPEEVPLAALVQIRAHHQAAGARIWPGEDETTVVFQRPQRAITPGQAAVIYRGDLVLGGGVIHGPAGK